MRVVQYFDNITNSMSSQAHSSSVANCTALNWKKSTGTSEPNIFETYKVNYKASLKVSLCGVLVMLKLIQ